MQKLSKKELRSGSSAAAPPPMFELCVWGARAGEESDRGDFQFFVVFRGKSFPAREYGSMHETTRATRASEGYTTKT